MNNNEIFEELVIFIIHQFVVEREDIDFDKSLIDQGIIDSLGLIEITTFIEDKFEILVKDDQMNRDNFGSVNKMVNFISKSLED